VEAATAACARLVLPETKWLVLTQVEDYAIRVLYETASAKKSEREPVEPRNKKTAVCYFVVILKSRTFSRMPHVLSRVYA